MIVIMELKIYKLHSTVPDVKYATQNSACFDVSAYFHYQYSFKTFSKDNKEIVVLGSQDSDGKHYIDIPPEWRMLVPTGLILDIPEQHCVKIYPRSGLSSKKGLNLINCVGIIDSDYVEQLFMPLYNNSQERVRIYSGDRIAQGELCPIIKANFDYIATRPEKKTNRNGGFGSTGIEWTQLNNS
jgi:dUTP pyrophosphatase